MEDDTKRKPCRVLRCGAVQAAVWVDSRVVNDKLVESHSVRIERTYRSGETWAYTNSFNAEDLPKVFVVAMEAYKFIRLKASGNDDQPEGA